jgi:diguanylate cyclase (GGDEF)-like protein
MAAPPTLTLSDGIPMRLEGRSISWVDTSGGVRVEQLEARAETIPWRVRRRDQQDRLEGGALWIHFEAKVPPTEHWYLEIGAAVYRRVQMFHRDRSGAWVVQEAGTSLPVSQWAVPGRLPTFALSTDDTRPVRYWVRVEDDRSDFSAPITIFREDGLQAARERSQFLYGAYFGLAALIALASLVNGIAFRDKAFLAFTLYIALLGAGQLGRAGVGSQHVWREWQIWNETALALWPGAATAAALWFVKVVTDPARLSRALDLAVWGLIAALLAAVALDVVVSSKTSMTLVLALTGLSLIAIMSMVVWGWLDGKDPHLRLIALGFLPVLVMAMFPLARGFGLMPTNLLTRVGLFVAAAIELPILYYALNIRLFDRREGELRANALSRTDALTGLPHRQGLIERLDSSLPQARAQKQMCALLGVRIANLDAIAEEFGKDAAEKALVVAASHLRRAIVGFDMAARVGEREFALLMEAPVTQESVSSRAQQVVASGLRQVEALPAALTLKFHVTVALLPHPQMDGAASLRWVLDALDQITPDARKLIRPLNF